MERTETPVRGPTIYDVARRAGLSIASVSRVLNGSGSPRADTRERVLAAVGELGFVPDGAARALSSRLKEVVGVVLRQPEPDPIDGGLVEDEGSLLFGDVINRGVETAAWARGYDLLLSSVRVTGDGLRSRIDSVAGKSDGLILHDQVLDAADIARLARRTPVVTLSGAPTPGSVNVRGDNAGGMRALVRHLAVDHEYRSLAYLAGDNDSPDNQSRAAVFAEEAGELGVAVFGGPEWQGNYLAGGGARAVRALVAAGRPLPRAIVCANDQTALGVLRGLAGLGIAVPERVAVAGFDDLPLGRHLSPPLTTVRQPIRQLGATAFEVLHGMITGEPRPGAEVVLPTELILRASCGCPPE